MKNKKIIFLNIFILSLIYFISANAQEMKKNQNLESNLKDPFSRGIKRSPEFGYVNERPEQNLNRQDDLRALSDFRYYRVMGISENEKQQDSFIDINDAKKINGPQAYYIELESFKDASKAKQYILDFQYSFKSHIRGYLINRKIIKDKKPLFSVEIGPFQNLYLAQANCYFIKSYIASSSLQCENFPKFTVSKNEKKLMLNSTLLGLSQFALEDLNAKNLGFDIQDLTEANIEVNEGEALGPYGFYIIEITKKGIYLASIYGELAEIPGITFPINKSKDKNLKQNNTQTSNVNVNNSNMNVNKPPVNLNSTKQ
jgi:hypothetical protein